MIADIFYPIFTLTITILACFIRKKRKIVQGICTHTFTKASPWTPWRGEGGGAYSSPWTPSFSIIFGFSKNRCTHIFSVSSPESNRFKNKKFVVLAEYFEQQINCCSLSNKWKPCHRVINSQPHNLRTTLEK